MISNSRTVFQVNLGDKVNIRAESIDKSPTLGSTRIEVFSSYVSLYYCDRRKLSYVRFNSIARSSFKLGVLPSTVKFSFLIAFGKPPQISHSLGDFPYFVSLP